MGCQPEAQCSDVLVHTEVQALVVTSEPDAQLVLDVVEHALCHSQELPADVLETVVEHTFCTDSEDATLVEQNEQVHILEVASQGPPGPPGPPGASGADMQTRRAGVTISANTVVYEQGGLIYPLDFDDAGHVFAVFGLALGSGQAGAEIPIQQAGTVTDAAWTWAYGRVYLAASGRMTQTPPATGFSVLIGFATAPTSINLFIQDPIEV